MVSDCVSRVHVECLHRDVVGDDGLLLELEFLEGIRLKHTLNLYHTTIISTRSKFKSAEVGGVGRTEAPEVVSSKGSGNSNGVGKPFLSDNRSAND